MNDLRHAIRTFTRAPFLGLVIVASLAIGIGANTVVFSWLKSAVWNPLPGVTAPVVLIETKDDTGNYVSTSWLEYKDLCGLAPSFSAIAAQRIRALNLGDTEQETRVFAEMVSDNFFDVLGVSPQLGRFFRPGEAARPGSSPVAVISHNFWQHHFEGAADVIGRPLKLNGYTLTVIGVTPYGFRGGFNSLAFDVFAPLTMATELLPATSELRQRGNRPYVMLARLKPGATLGQARGELAAAAKHLIAVHPETNKGLGYEILPVWRSPRGGQSGVASLMTLQAFALLILIVVCANTATLLLARASSRQREIGVRLAIGAAPSRIVFQLLLESVCLALLGALAGLVVAMWGIDALSQIPMPGGLPIQLAPALDGTSLAFAVVLATGCGVVFGLAPALQLARGDVLQALRGGRGSVDGRNRLRMALVSVEIGVALVVLTLAGLFVKSFHNALRVSPGFDPERVMLAGIDIGGRGYTKQTGGALLDDILQRLGDLPGVERASAASYVPLDLRGVSTGVISIEGKDFDPNRKILYYHVTSDYFATMGIPLVAGADIAPRSQTDLPLDAVIDEEMARRYWPDENPVGRRFEVDGNTFVINGVARTLKLEKINEAPRPAAWLSMRTQFVFSPVLHVRAGQGAPRELPSAIRETIRRLDPDIALHDMRTLEQHLENNLFVQRVPAQMLSVLGPLALLLAAVGLYAVLAYTVARRTQEIGVRLTLGATPQSVVRLMIWESMRVVLVGAALGWIVALAAGWFMRGLFVGVPFLDPLIFAGVPAVLLSVAAFACWLPSRRAAEVNPIEALRSE